MSIAAQCPDCCTCPAPTTQWDSRSASLTKAGYYPGNPALDPSNLWNNKAWRDATSPCGNVFSYPDVLFDAACPDGGACPAGSGIREFRYQTEDTIRCCIVGGGCFAATTWTLSNEYTTADLISDAITALPAYPGTWSGTAGSFRNLSSDELSIAIREDRYRHIFPVPLVGSGECYRLSWVERFIAEIGVAVSSAEIVTRGVFRPTVTVTGDGTGALVCAVMASDGTVDFFRVLNPGLGYTTITITVEAAINGGTTATGTGNLVAGQLASVTKTASGNYLPTGAFSGGSGTGATITFTLDETGGLATSPLGSGGSGYTSAPTLTITPKVSGSLAARVDLHLGVETARCAVWDGEIPEDYDPEDSATWPIIGDGTNPYFELPVPEADGTTLTANMRSYCDCAACP